MYGDLGFDELLPPIQNVLPRWLPACADVDGCRFTSESLKKASSDYRDLYYGLKNLAAPKKAAVEKYIFE
jgi:hypothetical protein